MYTFPSRVRYSETDPNGKLKLSSITNYFQDCSTFMSEEIDRGISYLEDANRAWILNSWQIQVKRYASLGEAITTSTWAYDFKGIYGYRNFIMADERNEMIACANSIWVYMDMDLGRPTRIPTNGTGYPLEPPFEMEYRERKIELPEQRTIEPAFPVRKSNLDSYNHVNNGQYIKMAEDFLPDTFEPYQMRVEYRKSAVLGDFITPKIASTKNIITVVLDGDNEKPYAVVEFEGNQKV